MATMTMMLMVTVVILVEDQGYDYNDDDHQGDDGCHYGERWLMNMNCNGDMAIAISIMQRLLGGICPSFIQKVCPSRWGINPTGL